MRDIVVGDAAPLGRGKFSSVHLCWKRTQPARRFALKVIDVKPGDSAELRLIAGEIAVLKMLGSHSGIIRLFGLSESQPNQVRLVLELCVGGELHDRIKQRRCYPEGDGKVLLQNVLAAVAFMHARGVMHRDLKPENVLLSSVESHTDCKISDFGLARASDDHSPLPRSRSIVGTEFYMAPEIIREEEYGREVDVWALGVLTYVLLSGSFPFFDEVLHRLFRQIVERDLSFPDRKWRGVSFGPQDFIHRLLQIRPGDRPTCERALQDPWLRAGGGPTGAEAVSLGQAAAMQRTYLASSASVPSLHCVAPLPCVAPPSPRGAGARHLGPPPRSIVAPASPGAGARQMAAHACAGSMVAPLPRSGSLSTLVPQKLVASLDTSRAPRRRL